MAYSGYTLRHFRLFTPTSSPSLPPCLLPPSLPSPSLPSPSLPASPQAVRGGVAAGLEHGGVLLAPNISQPIRHAAHLASSERSHAHTVTTCGTGQYYTMFTPLKAASRLEKRQVFQLLLCSTRHPTLRTLLAAPTACIATCIHQPQWRCMRMRITFAVHVRTYVTNCMQVESRPAFYVLARTHGVSSDLQNPSKSSDHV